ncbi:MAG: DUF2065 domain-containing protein [Zetaproteobacteria bacterium CG_4_9_14_3_um_filter_49_83]|nr:MAG: hypothetical protein AUJ56_04915 [Zetaproteobacteria bacterium CG1_02_49_23]PIQ33927.1 MAG: hypothetical protein COW62_03800 [Zetaproteobacteria bacterium CG17_big_fil_post_rev_8_21_14_2_50_50_13]PIV30168.1 MAG: DUF2065 domain-containing protein [Zetaproteobacteria bacterium CG02_land_8_20_14_3_00_50_9]PIY54858.1 MAG: DUF2065 domain-containing protein [Zetaproteobacteria bacterium CG_4_10_14_0_8_um_filter_49_80]PJA35216.1 MAG: DUF2065 domain-containing protein [Zetaproteobacteria bacter
MQDLWAALGLVLLLEGVFYALFPLQMIEMMRKLPEIPPQTLRVMGLTAVAIGWLIIKLVR